MINSELPAIMDAIPHTRGICVTDLQAFRQGILKSPSIEKDQAINLIKKLDKEINKRKTLEYGYFTYT